ncbi:MAG TPA: hypothetical protein PKB03_08950 [Baekduia sp.]|nr:hypothetical protein [Baekduia sp.]
MAAADTDVVIEHPNRDKPESKVTRAIVVALLLLTAILMLFVQIGGWNVAKNMALLTFLIVLSYLVSAYFIAKWSKGLLPVAAGIATINMFFALVAVGSWSDRNADGFTVSTTDPGLLAIVCAVLVPLQILVIFFSLRGFQQHWNVEVERLPDGSTRKVASF